MSLRTDRIADLIRNELASLILRDIRDPRVSLATISRVEVSRDFSHANVRVSVIGSDEERAEALRGFESARGFLRRELAQRLSLRITPELHFFLDRGAEHSQRISELLDGLRPKDGAGDS